MESNAINILKYFKHSWKWHNSCKRLISKSCTLMWSKHLPVPEPPVESDYNWSGSTVIHHGSESELRFMTAMGDLHVSETISLYKFSIITKSGLKCQKVGVVKKSELSEKSEFLSCWNVGVVIMSELSEMSKCQRWQSTGQSNRVGEDDAASAYVLCPLNLSSSQFNRGSE